MELLRALSELQDRHGYLSDQTLRALAAERRVPLYRLEGLISFYPHFRRAPPPACTIEICRDLVCAMCGMAERTRELRARLTGRSDVELREVSCLGRCDAAPALAIHGHPAAPLTLEAVDDVLRRVEQPAAIPAAATVSGRRWACDPYAGPREHFATVVSLAVDLGKLKAACLSHLKESGLRGMGGAGFPTGVKWELVANEPASPKYVICNADESEPGTFKDRVILQQLPHLVIEGIVLAGLTVGAEQGYVYARHEYGPEIGALQRAIDGARRRGVLGPDAAGCGRPFELEVFISPGGYILGEETALLEALEDRRGEPRNKPPYPGQSGLWGRPTLINNVETFALAASIVHFGAQWWRRSGRRGCAGIKFASVSGDVARPGVYEVPAGTTFRELIELAGGVRDGRRLKAFLPGGASTDFLPAHRLDTPIDFDALKGIGSALGTGAVVVFDETRKLLPLAANLVRFFRNESCGKCVPCRIGSQRGVEILEAVEGGRLAPETLQILPDLNDTLQQTSICGLGQVALNPALSLMRNLPEELGG